MCGRYSLDGRARRGLQDQLHFNDLTSDELWDRFNIAPTQTVPILRWRDTQLEAVPMSWGFVPSFVKDQKPKQQPINARAESVASNGYFRGAFKARRCVFPATGYYEWHATALTGKQAHNICRGDDAPFLMAGIWDHWNGADRTAIIVGPAHDDLSDIHDRMPVFIPVAEAHEWLTGSMPELFLPLKADTPMRAYPVSNDIGNVRNQGARLIEQIPF